MEGKIEDNRMTTKEILSMVWKKFSEFSDPVNDARLARLLDGASLYERDLSARPDLDQISDILITFDSRKPFNMQQLEKELKPGFHVYWDVIHFDDIVISYFQDKISAFKYYRTLTPDILTCKKALIDTSKGGMGGIIVSEKLTGDCIKMSQYMLFQAWKQKKCADGSGAVESSDTPADGGFGVNTPSGGEADG